MENNNLLHEINLPYKEIIKLVNWAFKKSIKLKQKYSSNEHINRKGELDTWGQEFTEINDISIYNKYNDYERINNILTIKKCYDYLSVEGVYKTRSKTETYDVPRGSMDEGWRIVEGNFTETITIDVPDYLFSLPLDDVQIKMELEYQNSFNEHYKREINNWKNIIDEANNMITKAKELKSKLKY